MQLELDFSINKIFQLILYLISFMKTIEYNDQRNNEKKTEQNNARNEKHFKDINVALSDKPLKEIVVLS